MKKIIAEKPLSEYTKADVNKIIFLALSNKRSTDFYIQLEDKYTKNAVLYFSPSARHSGGGRVTLAAVRTYGDTRVIETVSSEDGDIVRWNPDEFSEYLYSYIKEMY